ncbi:GroES-like protein [Violaceomyces palustris]|uniref:GroES-like protein n=1 Tax=Violaceomyces palustris TaxID=1673888 RepID=A0ACD0P7H7_9BASI|nr:GroES-like protein [Violaceomyces palustris]
MSTTNTCAALHGPKDLRIEERPYQAPRGNEVQVRVRATGLCGSDAHYYVHGRNGDFALQHPMCLGHESAGEIVAIGSQVPEGLYKVGDRVAIEAGMYCGNCARCKEGRYNLCPKMRFASSAKTHPHLDGTLQKFINWPHWLVHPIPSSVSLTSAALVEPLSVVIQGLRRSKLEAGQSVLVLGAGAVGLLACAAAKASGASYVAAVDIDEGRLSFARDNGWADATYHLRPRSPPIAKKAQEEEGGAERVQDPRARRAQEDKEMIDSSMKSAQDLLEDLIGRDLEKDESESGPDQYPSAPAPTSLREGFDVTFECTGVPSCVQMGIFATRPGGKEVLIGMGTPIQTLPIGAAALREVDILGVFRYASTYPVALGMLAGGALRACGGGRHAGTSSNAQDQQEGKAQGRKMGGIENLVSHKYPLTKAIEAFETLTKGKDAETGRGVVKVFIVDEQP